MTKDPGAPRLFLIDSYGFIFRAYHARARMGAPPMRTSAGLSTEAVFIFSNMLRKLTRTYEPAYMVAVFESIGKTHRETEFAEYKANRSETPDELIQQIPWVRKLIDALSTSGLLDRGPFDRVLVDALQAAREVPTTDPVTAALWVSFADRVAEIMGDAAPPKAKGM